MTNAVAKVETLHFPHRHLLTVEGLSAQEINFLLDLADRNADENRQAGKKRDVLRGRTLINLFFEPSTRTQSSFELAGKRLGADVMNMSTSSSSMRKGETLIDTAITLNAMHPDILVVRHHASGAVELLAALLAGCAGTGAAGDDETDRRKHCGNLDGDANVVYPRHKELPSADDQEFLVG